jgi:glycosyltransferase involved in cell wall biosynthesis
MPDVNFVLVNDIRIPPADLPRRPNIRFLGYQPYSQIPSYIAAFDACIIPFHINHLTAAVNPIKALEYFALGKPVVTSYMRELEYCEPRIVQVRESDQFVQALRRVLTHDTAADRRARQEIARGRSWRRIAQSFLRVVTGEARETGF